MDGDKLNDGLDKLDDATGKGRYVKIKREDMVADASSSYDKIVSLFQEYAQFKEDTVNHIPLVVDVQKVLFKLMRANTTNLNTTKLAYCLNREMTNDAAEKLDFTKKSFTNKIGFANFVDRDSSSIEYENNDNTVIGFNTFTGAS